MDANLRFHINVGYLKNYLQTKHGWTNAVWNSIDMQAFGGHLKKLSLSQKTHISNSFTISNLSASTSSDNQKQKTRP
jgi:hypothetical protein